MSGVTNQLIEAATQAQVGHRQAVETIFEQLRKRHDSVVSALIHSVPARTRIDRQMDKIF